MSWCIATPLHLLLLTIIILRVASVDIITTIAGTGSIGYSGDDGLATSATLYYPFGVQLDSSGRHTRVNTLC